jgi:hypothetical protein
MATWQEVLSVPCPTCKSAADLPCWDERDPSGEGLHTSRIHRFGVVTEAIAHNEEVMSNDIEIHQPSTAVAVPETPGVDLAVWAEQARSAAIYAEAVCRTLMVPAQYRGKPAEATAAILAGAELGFDPMRALNAFDNIQGTPAPKAVTLRAIVLAQGHKVVIEESTAERAVVRARRREDDEWQVSTWDLSRARQMGLLEKDQWKKQPQAMLVARATAEVCRWIASDAIMGVPYAAEEIADQPPANARPIARKVTVADLDEMSLDEVQQAVHAGEIRLELITDQQRRTMFALWRDLGFDGDANRAQRLEITGKIVGDPGLESSSHLTREQADTVITALRQRLAEVQPAQAEGGAE